MEIINSIQTRGNCQLCGRDQAVKNGVMAHHGYTVKDGYFKGVCQGHQYQPLQIERLQCDAVITACYADAARTGLYLERVKSGEAFPDKAKGNDLTYSAVQRCHVYEPVDFKYASKARQQEAVESLVWTLESHIRAALSFAHSLEKIADDVHGKPLVELVKAAGPERIEAGEKRQTSRGVATVLYVDGAKVMAKREDGFKMRLSSRAWRAFPRATA